MIMDINEVSRHMASVELDELSLNFDGLNYLVIFGHHVNGGFIALPNAGICVEGSRDPNNTIYNSEKLQLTGLSKDHADTIAHAIKVLADVSANEKAGAG